MMMTIKELIKKLWQWILDQTDIDEKIQEEAEDLVKEYRETKAKIKEVKAEVEHRIDRVKEEVSDIVEVAQTVKKQINDVKSAATGSERKGRKPSKKITKSALRAMKKEDLIDLAKTKFKTIINEELDKTTIINKVYELHLKK